MSEIRVTDPTEVRAEPIYSLETGETLIAESHTLEGIINAAKCWVEEGGELDGVVVMRSGTYDAATTGLIQENWV